MVAKREKFSTSLLPDDWRLKKIEQVAKIIMGQSPPGKTYNIDGSGMAFLQGKAEFGACYPKNIKYTTQPIKKAPKGSVLISVRAPVGDVNIADIDYCIGRGLAAVYSDNQVNTFLYYLLKYLKPTLEMEGTGSTFKAINKTKLLDFFIPLPPLSEQHNIAYILSTIQQAIEATDKVITAAQELKKSLMQHLFTYGPVSLEEAEQISFKETEVGILPEHWEVVNLGNIANVKGGKRLPKGHEFSDVTTPYPYLRVLDFKNNSIDISNLKYLTYDDYEAIKNYTITSNDIYISIAGTIGLVGLIPEQLGDANLTENAAKIVIQNPKGINNKFLMFFLVSPKGQRQIKSFSTKTSQPKLALTRIRQIMVALPPLSEQTDISDVLQKVMWKIEREENKKYVLQSLFNSMLHNLMTGKLRVNDLDLNIPEEVAQ